jgi:hypothetical protein
MKTKVMLTLILTTGLPMASRPLVAHHGGAVYDTQKPLTLVDILAASRCAWSSAGGVKTRTP